MGDVGGVWGGGLIEMRDWEDFDGLLGRVEDALVARARGCSVQAVYQRRMRLRIAAFGERDLTDVSDAAEIRAATRRLVMERGITSYAEMGRQLGREESGLRKILVGDRPLILGLARSLRIWLNVLDPDWREHKSV